MKKLHLANTQFEWELTQTSLVSPEQMVKIHPVFTQLQFLPLLYAEPEEGVAVSSLPAGSFGHRENLHLLSTSSFSSYTHIESWGASRNIARFAEEHQLLYSIPSWDVVRTVNSKAFSFTHSPKLPRSALLTCQEEAEEWLRPPYPKVLKSCFGVSGKGHLLIHPETPRGKIFSFLQREWQQKLPVLAEPWVDRLLDFSTQWEISETLTWIGSTICENDATGKYVRNRVGGSFPYPDFLEEHQRIVLPLLQKIQALGYFGNVGIDAFIYQNEKGLQLHPVVEINARKTMGWVALKVQQRHFAGQTVSIRYIPSTQPGLLPLELQDGTRFQRQLFVDKE